MFDPVAARADATPERTAVADAAGDTAWSYAELDAAVGATAGRLAASVSPGDHVGTVLATRPAFVRVAFAAWRLGTTLVPLSDRLTAAELAVRRRTADIDCLVHGEATAGAVGEAAGDATTVAVERDEPPAASDAPPAASRSPGDTCLLVFTSGTTGDPKAVRHTPRTLAWSAVASAFRLGVSPTDRWFDPLSVAHMGGLAPLLRSTLYGTGVVLQRGFDPEGALDAMAARNCTGVSLVPTMLSDLLDAGDLPDLRFVLLGGAPTPPELVERCERRGVPVHPTYGATETASQVATATPQEAFADPGTVGRPLFGTGVAVVDETGDGVPAGETGELLVSGPTVSPGYYGAPEATEAAFDADGFHTGDLGYRDEAGRLHVGGRRDDRILTGGETVDPAEVEAALTSHPAVRAVAVVGLPDERWGERVAALVVAEGVDAETLRAHCRERLAGFKLPRTVGVAAELPRTASGTVDRQRVRERLRASGESPEEW
jgi:O-succinylbenzoic acid--CoA ligase